MSIVYIDISGLAKESGGHLQSIDEKTPALSGGAVPVIGIVSVSGTVLVSGTFWQATQPVSAASLPLPTGAATTAKQPALGTAGSASTDVLSVQGVAGGVAQPMSAASLPLPAGASTAANQSTQITALSNILAQLVAAQAQTTTQVADLSGSIRLLLDYIVNPMRPELNASAQLNVNVAAINATLATVSQLTKLNTLGAAGVADAGSLPTDAAVIAFNNLRGRFL